MSKSLANVLGPLGLRLAVLHPDEIEFGERERKDYDDGGELLESIRQHGILQNLVVLERPDARYLLLAGGRRYRAACNLQLSEVPVAIATTALDAYDIKNIELIENLHRRKLSDAEDLALKRKLHLLNIERHGAAIAGVANSGWKQENTAALIGVDRSTLAKDLILAEALESFPELAECKNKSEMQKALKGMIRDYSNEVRAAEVDARMSDGPKKHLCDSYIIGDFFEREASLPPAAFNFIEVDPFYGIELIDLYQKKCGGSSFSKENYSDCPPEVYEWYIGETMRRCFRLASDGAWGICWFAFEPWFEPTYQAITRAGFFCRRVPGFWIQPSGALYNPNLLASAVDSFFYFRKGPAELARTGHLNTYAYNTVPAARKIHPTERPVELYEDIITTFALPGARMLVPFVGSGNQLLAAANKRITAIGFDLCQAYKDGYTVRVHEGDIGHYHSY
jgi:ParB/RepB/Spo0J family partition protein